VPNREFMKYGGLLLAPDGRVVGHVGRGPAAAGSFHFVGPQLVHRDAFATVPRGAVAHTIRGVYDELMAARPGSIRGCVFPDAHYWDVGTVADYWRTSWALTDAAVSFPRTSAAVTQSILWERVMIGAGATIDQCIVTDDVEVPAGAHYSRSILVRGPEGGIIATPLDVE
jgi:NDP-sugar pyrophosphorylase family protein